MARRNKNKRDKQATLRLPHNKDSNVNVGFSDAEIQDVDRLVGLELPTRVATEQKFGRATVVREHAMAGIRRRLGELDAKESLEPVAMQ